MDVPLSVDEIYPVTLSYTPSVVPVTFTLKVQLPPAESEPPVNAIVLVAAVVTRLFVPPHCEDVASAIDRPVGTVSVIVTPVNA